MRVKASVLLEWRANMVDEEHGLFVGQIQNKLSTRIKREVV